MGGAVMGYRMLQTVQQFGVFVREVIQQLRQCCCALQCSSLSWVGHPPISAVPAQSCSQDRTVPNGSTSAPRGEPVCEES